MCKLFAAVGLASLLMGAAEAQPCLVRGDSPPLSFESFAGPVRPKLTDSQPGARIVALLFDATGAEQQLAALHRAAPAAELVIARGNDFVTVGPARTFAAWQKAIREAPDAPMSVARVYSALPDALAAYAGDWSNVILVGLPAELDAEIKPYALPWLAAGLCRQKLRISYWTPDGQRPAFWNAIAAATAGSVNMENLGEFPQWAAWGSFQEATWPAPPLSRGFVLESVKIAGTTIDVLESAPGARLPSPADYVAGRRAALEAAALLRTEKLDESQAQHLRDQLQQALRANPLDPDALRAGATFYARFRDPKTAAALLASLVEVRPHDSALLAELGRTQFQSGDADAAEKSLLAAHTAGAPVAEDLAHLHLAHHDDRGALPFLNEALSGNSRSVELWYARADAATRLRDWPLASASLEKALDLDVSNLARRTSLISLYLEHGPRASALPHIRQVTAALPAAAAVRRQYATFLDELGNKSEALAVWKKALESDPAMELAHDRVATLLLDAGNLPDALSAADAGIAAAPGSARLHLLKCRILERQGHFYAAREALRLAAKTSKDPALLSQLAGMEDVSGGHAAAAYAAALAVVADDAERQRLLQRGLEVALRDGDVKATADFRKRVSAAGKGGTVSWLLPSSAETEATATVPGGLEALAFIVHSRSTAPQRFFEEYCRTLVNQANRKDPKQWNAFVESIKDYFQSLATLKSLGVRRGSQTELEVSRANKAASQKTQRILDLFGWSLRAGKEGLHVEVGEKQSQARRQELASALAVSDSEMQAALRAAGKFTFSVEDAAAPVLLGEARWQTAFFPKEKLNGGLAEAFARDVHVAEVYAALSSMGPHVVAVLVPGADLKSLADKHADLLYRHASAFALHGAHAAVPGGIPAEAIWEKMVGASPASPGRFYRALLEKDDGRMLAFFDMLGQLDATHQRFYTLNASRTPRFYELFRESADVARGGDKAAQASPFLEFLREVPLDSDLRVLFPGSPEVWMVAKGKSSTEHATKLVKKLSRVTAPDQEDEILLRILRTHYSSSLIKTAESQNFVAVVRVDRHRDDPLDDTSALLLAQHYSVAGSTYPYFASLTALGAPQFTRYFALVDQMESLPRPQLNLLLGDLHSLVKLLALLQESVALPPQTAAQLFGSMCERLSKAAGPADYAAASLDSIRDLLARAAPQEAANPDAAIERMLFGSAAPVRWESDGKSYDLDPVAARIAAYRKVLAEQKITPLKTFLECDRLLRELSEAHPPAERLKALDGLAGGILDVTVPKASKMSDADRKLINDHEVEKVPQIFANLKQRFARKKVNLEDAKKAHTEFLEAVSRQVRVSLSGVIYAYFLNPDDLLVSEDPLLVRKHRFLDLIVSSAPIFAPSDIGKSSEGAGSHLSGGFAQFFRVAGEVALAGDKLGNNELIAAAQVGSLRATDWRHMSEDDLRVLGLRLRVAREWILHAGSDPSLLDALAEDTLGLLSATRRAQLLDAIASRDWESALNAPTLGDFYALSTRYLERFDKNAWQSPVVAALRAAPSDGDGPHLRWLGGSAVELMGCAHPHLAEVGPYEQYEWLLLPQKLSERTAEFKLFLADVAGAVGVPPAAFGTFAEPLARRVMAKARMTDLHDWRSMQRAFASLDESQLTAALDDRK